jgi:hypothetical protein
MLSRIRTYDPGVRASKDSSYLRLLGYRDRHPNNRGFRKRTVNLIKGIGYYTCQLFQLHKFYVLLIAQRIGVYYGFQIELQLFS